MEQEIKLLTEQDAIWTPMLAQALKESNIPCMAKPVYGAGFAAKTGIQDRMRIYVPAEYLEAAKEILAELFPET